jgi:aryl-alcohol dehydrogenase-like predicted oxidoreductase
MLIRTLGRHGITVSAIGFGGIMVRNLTIEQATAMVDEAVGRGVNYFDIAPTYGDSDSRLGPALKPHRDKVFLACKTAERTAAKAEMDMQGSMDRLQTDHFDLFQLHAITDVAKDVDAAFMKGGVMEMVEQAKRDGRVRRVGFSAHDDEAALTALSRYDFDSVMFPVNFATSMITEFEPAVLKKAAATDAARIAIKALATHKWDEGDPLKDRYSNCWYKPLTDPHHIQLALRWTLSQNVHVAIPSGDWELFKPCMDVAEKFEPITAEETAELRELAESFAPLWPRV